MNWYKISQSNGPIKAYHGTCESYYDLILEEGLRNPYLSKEFGLAKYYAEQITSLKNRYYKYGVPIILEVTIHDTNNLRYDKNSMNEPVMVNESERDEAWNQAALMHPEWVEDDIITVPDTEWEISWNGVGAAKYKGVIGSEDVMVVG